MRTEVYILLLQELILFLKVGSSGKQLVKAAYSVGVATFCVFWKKLRTEIPLDIHYMLYTDSPWLEEFAEQINANRAK